MCCTRNVRGSELKKKHIETKRHFLYFPSPLLLVPLYFSAGLASGIASDISSYYKNHSPSLSLSPSPGEGGGGGCIYAFYPVQFRHTKYRYILSALFLSISFTITALPLPLLPPLLPLLLRQCVFPLLSYRMRDTIIEQDNRQPVYYG